MWTTLCVFLAFTSCGHGWIVNYDGPFTFTCPEGQFLSDVSSEHRNQYEDRRYQMSCRKLPAFGKPTGCSWTGYVNEFDHPVVYQCPDEGFVAGIDSYHENHYEDRRFKYYCCKLPGTLVHGCQYSGWVNNFDQTFTYKVPDGKVLAGMTSYHLNQYEDRRFQFQVCDIFEL